jgi:hypothetical protein
MSRPLHRQWYDARDGPKLRESVNASEEIAAQARMVKMRELPGSFGKMAQKNLSHLFGC